MRIIVNGQQAFGKSVLEALLDRGEEVVGVYCAPDKEGKPVDPIKEAALERGLPVFQPASFKDQKVWEQMRTLKPDLCVMAYVIIFVPQEALDIPTHGTIQYHPSLLPRHRGPSSINWPIIQGETKTGLTIFWPDEGLDEGPILLQKEVDIGPDETLGDVYFKKLMPLGIEAMVEAVDLVREGKAPKVPQDHSLATYESWCRRKDAEIDWSQPAQQVYNLIRGCNPQPGAWTTHNGKMVQIFDSRIGGGSTQGKPGEVVAVEGDKITIAAKDGQIDVKRVRPEGGGKVPAPEFASEAGLKVGDRLG